MHTPSSYRSVFTGSDNTQHTHTQHTHTCNITYYRAERERIITWRRSNRKNHEGDKNTYDHLVQQNSQWQREREGGREGGREGERERDLQRVTESSTEEVPDM